MASDGICLCAGRVPTTGDPHDYSNGRTVAELWNGISLVLFVVQRNDVSHDDPCGVPPLVDGVLICA